MTTRSIRLALAGLSLALLVPACSAPAGSSPSLPSVSVPASVQSAAASGLDAFCDLDLANDPEISAAVQSAQSVTTGGNVDEAAIGEQVDAAVAEIEAVEVSGDAATARDALVDALNAFGDDPSQASAAAVVAAHGAAVTAQDAACGS